MNTIIMNERRGIIKPSELPEWLLSHGILTFTTKECAHLLNSDDKQISNKLVYLYKNKKIVALGRGLWAVVPSENLLMKAPEPISYIDTLMNFYHCDYCIGFLTAAYFYGASHQVPQIFQVVSEKTIKDKVIGRSKLMFVKRSYIKNISKKKVVISNNLVNMPTIGTTMLMLCADLLLSGGIDNVATLINELAEISNNYMEEILKDAYLFQTSALRRLGWILDNVIHKKDLDELIRICNDGTNPSLLSPYQKHSGKIDSKWHLIINRQIETDI